MIGAILCNFTADFLVLLMYMWCKWWCRLSQCKKWCRLTWPSWLDMRTRSIEKLVL